MNQSYCSKAKENISWQRAKQQRKLFGSIENGHSVFTYYLLEGLKRNEKSVDSEGNVTPDSLGNYLYREIVNLPPDRRPKQKPIRKTEASGEIVLAYYPELGKKEKIEDPSEFIYDASENLRKGDYKAA